MSKMKEWSYHNAKHLWPGPGDGRGLPRQRKKPLMEELTEIIQEVVSPPAGNKTQWIENFIKETVKEKLDYLSQKGEE